MSDKNLVPMGSKSFEDLKKVNEYGAAYWSAREIQSLLGYTQWRRFEDAINRALTSCKQSGISLQTILPVLAKWLRVEKARFN